MKIKLLGLAVLVFVSLMFIGGCDKSESKDKDGDDKTAVFMEYSGSKPVGDFVEIMIDSEGSKVRHINHTKDEDSGWMEYSKAGEDISQGFSLLNKVDIDGGYVLFAEYPDVAIVYQEFDSSGEAKGWPSYLVLREKVDKENYYEKAYNWLKFLIDEDSANDSSMEAGFSAFDSDSNGGMLFGAGYNSYGDSISDINGEDSAKIDSFKYNEDLVSNTMWMKDEGNLLSAITLTGTESGTNILDFGTEVGGGMGIAVPQSDVTLSDAAGTYFLLCYENNKTDNTSKVNPLKVVVSASSPNLKVFMYNDNTDTAESIFSADLTALAELPANQSPGGASMIKDQFADKAGNGSAVSSVVKQAHLCRGTFVSTGEKIVFCIAFDPDGNYSGFTMHDTTDNDIIRFGFGLKDKDYSNRK